MPSPRISIRLTPALEAQVQVRVRQGAQVSDIVREALEAYFQGGEHACPTCPTPVSDTTSQMSDIFALLSDKLSDMTTQLERVERRLAVLEATTDAVCPCPTGPQVLPADPARPFVDRPRGGQYKLTSQEAAALRAKRAAGVPIPALMQEYHLARTTLYRYLQAQER
jgi:hypothetical protein